jgi:hypothetical protein
VQEAAAEKIAVLLNARAAASSERKLHKRLSQAV